MSDRDTSQDPDAPWSQQWPDDGEGGLDLTSGLRPGDEHDRDEPNHHDPDDVLEGEPGSAGAGEHDYYEAYSTRRRRTAWSGRPDPADERPRERSAPASARPSGGGGGGGARRRRRTGRNLAPVIVLALVAALVVGGGAYGFSVLKDRLAPPADYAGPGTGKVYFQVHDGDSVPAMGRGLARLGVVKSADAFVDAARQDDRATGIQVGYYSMKKQMKASGALGVLVDPDNLVQSVVLVREGARVRDVVKTIVARTDFSRQDVVSALESPKLGLPAAAKGNPEGYLFPATYTVTPGGSALTLLQQMVAKTKQVEDELGLVAKAKTRNLDPQQVLTVASILQYEANRSVDYPKVARVIYNRLNQDMALQLDSTVSYTSGRSGDVWTTSAERASNSAYNTYQRTGLPPGPIGSPGEETIRAALNPAKGDWLYFVPDFAKGTTLFTSSYSQHLKNVAKAKQYCRTHDSC